MSMSRTFQPTAASAVARLIAVVVLPTPPFWFATATLIIAPSWPPPSSAPEYRSPDRCSSVRPWLHSASFDRPAPVPIAHFGPSEGSTLSLLWIDGEKSPAGHPVKRPRLP